MEATGTILFQHRMPRYLKLSHVPKSHTLSRMIILTVRNLSWPKLKKEEIDITSDSDSDEDELEIL